MNGNTIRRRSGNSDRYYGCRALFRKTPRCPVHHRASAYFRTADIHAQARAVLADTLRTPEAMRALMTQDHAKADPHAEQREALEKRKAALIDLHLEGLIDRDEFIQRRDDLTRQIQRLSPIPTETDYDTAALEDYALLVERVDNERLNELCKLLKVEFVVVEGGKVVLHKLSVPELPK